MTGLEKIVKQIQDEARQAAEKAVSDARAQASEIVAQARRDGEAQSAAIRTQSAADVENQLAAAQSAAELTKRRAILAAKQEIIGEIISDAHREICALPDEAYFDLILKMVPKYALPQEGEIIFSLGDLKRLPSGFAEKISAASGGKLSLSTETRRIDGGFVLVYGGIEENCSIEALFYTARERLQDKVQELLFS